MADTYLVDVVGKDGEAGMLATTDHVFAKWLKELIEREDEGFTVHIKTVTAAVEL